MRTSLLLLALIVVLSGCGATVKSSAGTSYQSDNFHRSSLVTHGVAVLPVVAGAGVEGFRRPFGASIVSALDSVNTSLGLGVEITGWRETMQALNEADLTTEYQTAIQAYRQTAVLDAGFLRQLSETLGTPYVLYLALGDYEADSETSYSMFSGSNRRETAAVNAYGQIWSAAESDIVWEGTASASAEANSGGLQFMRESDRDPAKLADLMARALADELLGSDY